MHRNKRLRQERELRGWSQERLAEAVGTTARTVHRWESGQAVPYPYYRERLCALFGKNAEELDLLPERDQEPAEEETREASPSPLPYPIGQAPNLFDPMIPMALTAEGFLIGRDSLLAQLMRRLGTGGSPALTAFYGLPGVGKTALAVALAAHPEMQRQFRDGILWVGLGTEPNVLGLLARWGTLLGVSAAQVGDVSRWEAWGMAVRTAIGTRRMLLIIDDAWKAEEALAFQVGGPDCAYLVTTRLPHVAFAFAGEGAVEVSHLSEADGLALLARFAPEIIRLEAQSASSLVHSVGSLPLALTLMGKYLRSQSFTRQPRRLYTAITQLNDTERRLQLSVPTSLLERSPSLPSGIPLSLYATIAVSDQQLSEQARRSLYALSVFPAKPNSFSEAMAVGVTGEAIDVLDELSDAGLLENSGPGRYMVHQTISDYAKRLLGTTTDVHERWITWSVAYAETHHTDYAQLDPEIPTLLAAFEAAYRLGKYPELIRGVCAVVPFLQARGLHPLARERLQQAYTVARSLGDSRSIITISCLLGKIAGILGATTQAEDYLQEGLALARQQDDPGQVCYLLSALAFLETFRGKPAQAKAYAQEGLAIARQLGSPKQIVDLLIWLGLAAYEQQDYALAGTCCQEAFPLARQINDREAICYLLAGVGWVATALGNYAQAEAYYQEGMEIAQQFQHSYCTCLLLTGQGWLAGKLGNYAQAEVTTQKALELARSISAYELIYRLLTSLGWLAETKGEYDKADAFYQEALLLAYQHEKPRLLCLILFHLGKLRLKQQQYEAASIFFQEMLKEIPDGSQDLVDRAQSGLAQITLAQSRRVDREERS